jgi:hypothetical protein
VAVVLIVRWWKQVEVKDPVTGILTERKVRMEKEIDQVKASLPYTLRVGDRILVRGKKKGRLIFYLCHRQGRGPTIHYGRVWGPKPNQNVRLSTLPLEAFACGGIDPRWEVQNESTVPSR